MSPIIVKEPRAKRQRNRFIHKDESKLNPIDRIMGPDIIRAIKVHAHSENGTETYWALADQMGFLLEHWEAMEIIEAVLPFYDQYTNEQIKEANEHEMNERYPRHSLSKTPKNPSGRARNAQKGYVYLMRSGKHYKIGASKDPDTRRDFLGTKPPFEIEIVCTIPTDDMFGLEDELHVQFSDKHVNGEWFELEPSDVAYIKGLAE